MDLSQSDMDLIERALDNTLTPVEQVEFDHKLKAIPRFKDEYDHQCRLLGYAIAHHRSDVKEELKALYEEFKKDKAPSRRFRPVHWSWYGIAASIIIGTSVFIFLSHRKHKDSQDLYVEYYEPFQGAPLLRGEGKDSLQMALSAYYNEDYGKALDLFTRLDHPNRSLFIGNCYMNLGRLDEAEEVFLQVLQDENHIDREAARWYLALLYLGQEKEDQAQKLLRKFITGDYHRKAVELLEDL